MSRHIRLNIDGTEFDEEAEAFDDMIESQKTLSKAVEQLKSQLKPKQPDGVGCTTMERTIRDEDGVEWVEYYNGITGQWELQYYIDEVEEESKQEECQRGIWCEKCEHYMLSEGLEFCELMITCKSFKLKGEQ